MGELIIMMGIPGSGKSTFAKSVMDLGNDIYVSRDDIRFKLLKNRDDYFSHEDEVWNLFVKKIVKGLQQNKKVWADATHINKASRRKLLNAVYNKITPDSVSIVFVDTDVKVALERNNNRGAAPMFRMMPFTQCGVDSSLRAITNFLNGSMNIFGLKR